MTDTVLCKETQGLGSLCLALNPEKMDMNMNGRNSIRNVHDTGKGHDHTVSGDDERGFRAVSPELTVWAQVRQSTGGGS